jgi:hypothetical protein
LLELSLYAVRDTEISLPTTFMKPVFTSSYNFMNKLRLNFHLYIVDNFAKVHGDCAEMKIIAICGRMDEHTDLL